MARKDFGRIGEMRTLLAEKFLTALSAIYKIFG